MALQLIYNFQKCPTSLLSISSERSLRDLHIHAIVVHTAVVIMCNRNNSLLNELHKVIQLSPDVKVNCYYYCCCYFYYYINKHRAQLAHRLSQNLILHMIIYILENVLTNNAT